MRRSDARDGLGHGPSRPLRLYLWVAVGVLALTALIGCNGAIGDYRPASTVSKDGFARNPEALAKLLGREVKIWGYVDQANIYGDASSKAILGDAWSGDASSPDAWRFGLMGGADDPAGKSFSVLIPNDSGRDALLRAFAADASAGRPTRVFVTGRLKTFDAPTNVTRLTGLYMRVRSSQDITLTPPE
jgi:hypothetical protein